MHNHVLASHIFSQGWTFIWFTTHVLGVAVDSSNGYLPKSASEKYDQPGQPSLNTDSNQQQSLMSESEDFLGGGIFFFVSSRPVWCEGCADPDGAPLALKFKLTICLFLSLGCWFNRRTCSGWRKCLPKNCHHCSKQTRLFHRTSLPPPPM